MTLLGRIRQATADEVAEWAVLAIVLAIAAAASYLHLRDVWRHTGAPIPDLGPLLVDGLFAAAWLRMRRRRREGSPVGWLAWAALVLALAATVAGNIAAAWIAGHRDPLSLVVAAWPALAFALVWELVTGHARQPAPAVVVRADEFASAPPPEAEGYDGPGTETEEGWRTYAFHLIDQGMGRAQLARELDVSPWRARQLLAEHRQAAQEAPA